MKINWKSQKGYTGIDIAVSVTILIIFVVIIATIFFNIYIQYTEGQRNATASACLAQISETIDKMYFQEIDQSSVNNLIAQMNIPNGYTLTATVERFVPENQTIETSQNLVKKISLQASYEVSGITKTLKFNKIKSKEVLITPNKPKLSNKMIPVKFVLTNVSNNDGYYIVTSPNETTWYNYTNKNWAKVMLMDGLTVEGNIVVTQDNMVDVVGKRVIIPTKMFEWIPRYSSNGDNVEFVYSTSNKMVNNEGNLQELANTYSVSTAFENITGFWIAEEDNYGVIDVEFERNVNLRTITVEEAQAVQDLSGSRFGKLANSFQTITNARQVIIIN